MALSKLVLTLAVIGVVGTYALAQTIDRNATKTDYKPTELQSLRLQSRQKDLVIIQLQLQDLNRQFAAQLAALHDEADKVKAENSWPKDTQFNDQTLVFSAPAPPAAPTTAPATPAPGMTGDKK